MSSKSIDHICSRTAIFFKFSILTLKYFFRNSNIITTLFLTLAFASNLYRKDSPLITESIAVDITEQQTAFIGIANQELTNIGFAYCELYDDFGYLESTFLEFGEDGSYSIYIDATLRNNIVGIPYLLFYNPLKDYFSDPQQVNFFLYSDSVTATFTRIMATGDTAQIRAFLELMKDTGQLTASQLAQLEARYAVVQAAEVAAAQIASAAAA